MTESVQVQTVDNVSPPATDGTLLGTEPEVKQEVEATPEVEAAESKDETIPAEAEPAEYKIEIEGVELDQEMLDEILPLFKDAGVSNEAANKLAKYYADKQNKEVEKFHQLTQSWAEQAKKDKDIGGDKFEKTVSNARLAIDKLGTPALRAALNEYGMGNHPEIIRAFAKMGEMMGDDTIHKGDATPKQTNLLDRLYKD